MNMKKYISSIVLILTIGILFPQNLESFTQKINLENSLKEKIYSELEKTLDKNKDRFVVIVNLEIGRYKDLLNNKSKNTPKVNNRGMEYLPGVPLSGSKGISNNNQSTSNRRLGADDYIINEIDIEVWIEPSLANGANEKMIESLIKGIIPQTAQCDDCITIETMNFNSKNNEDSEIEKLRKELNDMKDQARKDQMVELNLQLADLKAQLEDSENELQTWAIYLSTKDSIRLAFLEDDREQSFQKNQEKVDDLTAQVIAEKDAQINSQTGGNALEGGGSSGGISGWLIGGGIFLLALSAIAFLMILINKKSVVYLKPKDPNNNSNDTVQTNETDTTSEVQSSSANAGVSQSSYPGGTAANVDESVLSSELKALRQSSIAMSASQKEGATQIIKDWMDDGSPKDADNAETEGEE